MKKEGEKRGYIVILILVVVELMLRKVVKVGFIDYVFGSLDFKVFKKLSLK